MRRPDLQELSSFVAVARHKNFRRAAAELGMSPSALSHAMRSLEDRLGVKLLQRTTRSVSLTQSGSDLLQRIEPAFREIADATDGVQDDKENPRGLVRLSVPKAAASLLVAPAVAGFARRYPGVALEVSVNDNLVDIVAERFDAGIRLHENVPRDMVAVRASPPLRGVVVGAPIYLHGRTVPEVPDDLKQHVCINYRHSSGQTILDWEFDHPRHGPMKMHLPGQLTFSDMDLVVAAAVDGAGLALVVEAGVQDLVRDGKLVRLLDEWSRPFPGFCIYYPTTRHMSAALRAVIDYFRFSGS